MEGFAGKVAVLTGAGSGIGQALAIELARSGASLAISDVDPEGLAATEERFKAIGAPVKADRLDVTERQAFELYADASKRTSARSTSSPRGGCGCAASPTRAKIRSSWSTASTRRRTWIFIRSR